MSKYSEELKTFTNEKLMSAYSDNKRSKKFFKILFWIMLSCAVFYSAVSIAIQEGIIIVLAVLSIGLSFLMKWCSSVQDSGIMECENEIEKRLASGELSQSYVDEVFRPKTKEEKKESRITWGCLGVIIIVIIFIFVACSMSSENKKHQYDDVFNKNPNNWSDDEKDYVNDLFDWMKKNN